MKEEATGRTGHTVLGPVHFGLLSTFWMINGQLVYAEPR